MTNTPTWDRIGATQTGAFPTDVLLYGPDGPTERELRLMGDTRGKRVLDLGCGTGQAAVALAKQGAIVIAVDASAGQLAHAREIAEAQEVKVEWRQGDLADLAFLRAESIDVAFSAFAVAEIDDIARLFRQVQRVLKPGSPFVFSYEHPMALVRESGGVAGPEHSYFEPGPVIVERHGEPIHLHVRPIESVFTELGRAGFRVDTIAEPLPGVGARVPSTIVWRARKEGA
ncbi:MAG TPA: class I SAM-dependent methyltransferase [Acidimicrobiia bacterium]